MQRIALFAVALSFVGCVPKSQYLELEDKYGACNAAMDAEREKTAQLEEQLDKAKKRSKARVKAFLDLIDEFRPLIDRGILEITVAKGSITIGMAADVLFPSGSAQLSDEGQANIREVARLLGRRTDREFQVQGHTDTDPIRSAEFPDNWHLGAARALNVVQFMIASGMSADQLSAATFGEHQPVATNDSDEGKSANRRIEIVFLPDLSDMPGHKELIKAAKEAGSSRPRGEGGDRPPRRGKGRGR